MSACAHVWEERTFLCFSANLSSVLSLALSLAIGSRVSDRCSMCVCMLVCPCLWKGEFSLLHLFRHTHIFSVFFSLLKNLLLAQSAFFSIFIPALSSSRALLFSKVTLFLFLFLSLSHSLRPSLYCVLLRCCSSSAKLNSDLLNLLLLLTFWFEIILGTPDIFFRISRQNITEIPHMNFRISIPTISTFSH